MKSTGIVRRVDELGRIVLPMELRRQMDIEVKSEMEIFVDGSSVILRKAGKTCVFCNGTRSLTEFKSGFLCGSCVREILKLKGKPEKA